MNVKNFHFTEELVLDSKQQTSEIIFDNCSFVTGVGEVRDAVRITGKNIYPIIFNNCIFFNPGISANETDELVSIVNGGSAHFFRCYFLLNGKAVLVGNGDFRDSDPLSLEASFEECVFERCSRRQVYVQDGKATMHRCMVKNWGVPESFYEKSFGSRSGHNGILNITDTIYKQRSFLECINKNIFSDTFRQTFPEWIPGFMKGITSDNGGVVHASRCHKNRWWIRLTGNDSYMSDDEAASLRDHLTVNVIHPWTEMLRNFKIEI